MDLFTPTSPAPSTSPAPDLLSSIDEHTKDDVFTVGGITMKSIPLESGGSSASTPRGSTNQAPATTATDEPIHIINIGLHCNENEELNDTLLSSKCHQFAQVCPPVPPRTPLTYICTPRTPSCTPLTCPPQSNKAQLHECGIRRISFLFCKERTFPKFFTFRARSDVS